MFSISVRAMQAAMFAGVANIAIVSSANAQTVSLDIPAQDLSSALQKFAAATNKDLLYAPALVANRKSSTVSGRFEARDALTKLLAGSGLTFRAISRDVYALQNTNSQTTSQATTSQGRGDVNASTGALSGTVFNTQTGANVAGARVSLQGTEFETVTDERGQYYFPAVPRGDYVVRVDYLGETSKTVSASVAGGMRQSANVELGDTDGNIVVVAYRSALQRALNQQNTADNNASIVSSDLLGGFPAETASEALRRIPGVAFGRDDATGEGSRITVRGFSSEAINVQLNGLELQGTGFQRTIDLSGFLADNISQITVQKSLLPSMEGNGSGGLVEIETKSGLDYGNFAVNLGVEGETHFDRSFGEEYQVNGTIAKKITPNFGVSGTLVYRKTDRNNLDVSVVDVLPPVFPVGFTSSIRIPPPAQFPYDPEISEPLLTGVAYTPRSRDEENLLASINLAWDIGSHTKLRLDLQRNSREAQTEQSRSLINFRTTSFDMPVPEVGGEVRRRSTISGFAPFVGYSSSDQKTVSSSISFRGETIVDRWTFEYKAGYSKAKSESQNVNVNIAGNLNSDITGILNPDTLVINPDDDAAMTPRIVDGVLTLLPNGIPVPQLNAVGQAFFVDPANYAITSAARTSTKSPTEAYFVEGSAKYDFDNSFLSYLQAGFKYDISNRRSNDDRFATATIGALKPDINYSRITGRDTSPGMFDPGIFGAGSLSNVSGSNYMFPILTSNAVDTIFDGLAGLTVDDPATAFNEQRFTFTDASTLDPILDGGGLNPAKTREERIAGYVEAKLQFGDFDAIGGVRMERVNRSGTTLSAPSIRLNLAGVQREPRSTFIDAGLVNFVDVSGTTVTWTPSLLVNYRPMDNLVARFAYFRSTVNPDFRLIRNTNAITIDLRTGNGSVNLREANPDLRPSTTDNYDFDVAYYFKDTVGLVRAGFFYKKISNNFTNVFFQNTENTTVRDRVLDILAPLVTTRPDLVDFAPDTVFTLNRPENGEGGKIYGFELEIIRELDFLPGFLSDFGILGNLTYTKGDFPTLVTGFDDTGTLTQFSLDRPLEDQAAWVYNASLDYAKNGFEGRIIYTHQSETVVSYSISDLNAILPSYSTLDLRLSYNFERGGSNWTIFLEGDDLLSGSKEADIRNVTGSTPGRSDASYAFPDSLQFNGGRTVTMGVRARF